MKRSLPIVVVLLALAGSGALAAWQTATVGGTPNDLQVQDAGQVVLATTTGAFDFVFSLDGGARDAGVIVYAGGFIGAWHDYDGGRPGALYGGFGRYYWSTTNNYSASASTDFLHMRHSSSGMGYAVAISPGLAGWSLIYEPTGGNSNSLWADVADPAGLFIVSGLTNPLGGPTALSALRLGPADFMVVSDQSSIVVAVDGGAQLRFSRGAASRDLSLFRNGADPGLLVVPVDGGLELVHAINVATPSFDPVAVPLTAPSLSGVAFSLEEGSDAGRGFGMAVGMAGATKALLRAVPDPADAGRVWVADGTFPTLAAGNFNKVACYGSTFCAAIVSGAAANNVLLYWNASPPWISPAASTVADNASTTVAIDAGDTDGDPIFITWAPLDAGYPIAFQLLDPYGWLASFTPDAGAFCGTTNTSYAYRVVASDGLASHDTQATATITVQHAAPLAPTVDTPDASFGSDAGWVQLAATAGPSGCPTSFSWSETTASGFTLAWDGGPTISVLPPSLACGETGHAQYQVRVVESGLISSLPATRDVWVAGGVGPPLAPSAASSGPIAVPAGSAPISIQASFADGGCSATQFVWSEQTDSGFRFDAAGGAGTFFPPTYACDPIDAKYDVRAVNSFGASPPTTVTFSVQQWGAPYPPVFAAAYPVQKAGGGTVVYSSQDAGHFCPGAPVELLIDGVAIVDGGPDLGVDAGTIGNSIAVTSLNDCVDGTVEVHARNWVADAGSDEGTLAVTIQTVLDPLADAGFFLDGGPADGHYRGHLSLSANCPGKRVLSAEITVTRDGGGSIVCLEPFPDVDAGVPAGCAGGEYFVTVKLLDDSGATGLVATDRFALPAQEPKLGEILVTEDGGNMLTALCHEGASGLLLMASPVGEYCPDQTVTWEQLDGPPLEQPVVHGWKASFSTVDKGFDELIGRDVRLRVSADIGSGNPRSAETKVHITSDPFVKVRHHTDSPIADEMGIASVAIELYADSDCGVTGATYDEDLDGLRFIPGTARLDGIPVEASAEGGVLHVSGLNLPSRERHELVYSARPPLLRKPAPRGIARLRDEPISERARGFGQADSGQPRGCGCAGAPSELASWVLLLVTAAAALGRRRRKRSS